MSDPKIITDHIKRAIGLLTEFDEAENVKVILSALVSQVQDLENLTYSTIVDRYYSTASGVNLDAWGVIVGEPRDGLTDEEYRRFIEARIQTNKTSGDIPTLLTVAQIITNSVRVVYQPNYPADYTLQFQLSEPLSDAVKDRVKRQICEELTPSGVGCFLVEYQSGSFGFDGSQPYGGKGFGEGSFSGSF
jgi:hypothetical protein